MNYKVEKWNDDLSVTLYACINSMLAHINKCSFIGYLLAADELLIFLHAV